MESILEYKGELEGKTYTCLYERVYDSRTGCYLCRLVAGSLKWDVADEQAGSAITVDSGLVVNRLGYQVAQPTPADAWALGR